MTNGTPGTIELNLSGSGNGGSDVLTQTAQPGSSLTFAGPTASDTLNVTAGTYTLPAVAAGSGIVPTTFGTILIGAGASLIVGNAAAHSDRTLLVVSNLSIAGAAGSWTSAEMTWKTSMAIQQSLPISSRRA